MSLKEKFLTWLGSFGDEQIRSATDRYEETCDPKLPPGAVVLSRPKREYAYTDDNFPLARGMAGHFEGFADIVHGDYK